MLIVIQVARVKNKWKCVLKDGMIHVNGKDYLFAKCTGYVLHLVSFGSWAQHVLRVGLSAKPVVTVLAGNPSLLKWAQSPK